MSFESDIQGNNTQLFPVVEIDGIWYSTNNVTVDGNYCKPILMNIPSIKESVDVESRKFKISNVSLQFNNFPFDGVRFSDQLSASSLINTEATIYFKSPSTNTVDTGADTDLHEAYKGIIRRISHDDTKVKVELEDLTEKNAHKDLPSESFTDVATVPDKIKNKPKQMVYGYVDKCPLIKNGKEFLEEYEEDTITKLEIDYKDIKGISSVVWSVGTHSFEHSGVMIQEGQAIIGIKESSITDNINFIELKSSSDTLDTAEIFREIVGLDIGRGEESLWADQSGTTSGGWEDTDMREAISRDLEYAYDSSGESSYGSTPNFAQSDLVDRMEEGLTKSKDNLTDTGIRLEAFSVNDKTCYHYIKFNLEDYELDMPCQTYLIFRIRVGGGSLGHIWVDEGYGSTGYVDISGYDAYSAWVGDIPVIDTRDMNQGTGEVQYSHGSSLDTSTDYDNQIFLNGAYGWNNYNEGSATDFKVKVQAIDSVSNWDSINSYNYINIGNPKSHRSAATASSGADGTYYQRSDIHIKEVHLYHLAEVDKLIKRTYLGNVRGRINIYDDHPELLNDNPTFNELVDIIEDNEAEIVENSSQENYDTALDVIAGAISLGSEDAYIDTLLSFISNNLNVDSFIQTPIDIIYDLVRSEIGHDKIDEVEYTEAKLQHKLTDGTDWKFGFTVNKKINSKKLIEEIAKSTKCFPKFKNDGTFGFNTIKDSYDVANDYAEATPIKESEVISYSFKKTKPEQIHKRVDVQYKKDYAQDSFLKRTDVLVTGEDTGVLDDAEDSIWKDDFYGIENSKDTYLEFESPYIRDEQTADALGTFLSEQYRNDHLLFNLKLPLQYINLEIGDLVKFEDLFQGLTAYGIDYRLMSGLGTKADDDSYSQYAYPLFMVTSTKKNLDSVEIECMQLHELIQVPRGQFTIPDEWIGQAQSLDSSQEGVAIIQPEEEEPDFTDGEQVEIPRESVSLEQGTIQFLSDINGELLFDYTLYNMFTPISFVRVESGTLSQVFELTSNSGFHKFNLTPRDIEAFDAYEIQQFDGDLIVTQLNPADIFQLGDVNLDGSLNILDIVGIVNHILGTGAIQSEQHADFNEDGTVNILDIVGMVNRILGVG